MGEQHRALPLAWIAAWAMLAQPALADTTPHLASPPEVRTSIPATRQDDADMLRVSQSPFQGRIGNLAVDIAFDEQPTVGMANTPYWIIFGAGLASVPLSVLDPFYGLGVLYPFFGAPLNAVFNSRRETLARVMAEEALPPSILAAMTGQHGEAPPGPPARLLLRLSNYGLKTRSGKPAQVMQNDEDLCLTAQATLTVSRDGRPDIHGSFGVGTSGRNRDAPPPICASIESFARDEGNLLRQSIRELAEILAVMARLHLEAVP